MKKIYLNVTVSVGVQISEAAKDSIRLAKTLDVGIDFQFNGLHCRVQPKTDIDKWLKKYKTVIADGGKYISA
jgi:hypothetical protein